MSTCKNCQHEFDGNFCSQCGQKVITRRLTISMALSNFFSTFFNLERGFIYTIKMMFVNPGKVVREYISGNTIKYTNPFRYILVIATLSTLLTVSSGVYDETTSQMNHLMGMDQLDPIEQAGQLKVQEQIATVMKKYLSFVLILLTPFFSLATYLLIRRKLNYAEHFVMNVYSVGQTTIIGIPVTLLFYFFPSLGVFAVVSSPVIMLAYFAYVYRSMFGVNYFIGVLLALVAYLLTNILFVIVGIIGAFIFYALSGGIPS